MIIFRHLKQDIPASLVVFLVAMPLCLGIALASGAPLYAGIVSGVVGGIVVGLFSGSHTSVSGPAAGLTAVILVSVAQLNSFELFLAAVVLSGLIQIVFGVLKLGFLANYIPSAVIQGLLTAIGLILILKQIPHAVGYDSDPQADFSFWQIDGENTFSELLVMLDYLTPGATLISVFALLMLVFWDHTPLKELTYLPAPLAVVVAAVGLNLLFSAWMPSLKIGPEHLVSIPQIDFSNGVKLLHIPATDIWQNQAVWTVAITLAIIATLETLLNVEAVDRIDPQKRETPTNRELIAQGAGNVVAGLVGGIPVTSVIVRSSVNLSAGAMTKMSAVLHGVLLMLSVLFAAPVLNQIPLAALAAILMVTGYKLTKISLFKKMFMKGWEQFVPFMVTVLAIVFTDLLKGVMIGTVFSVFYILRSNFRNPFSKVTDELHIGEVVRIELPNQVTFFNKAAIKHTLWSIKADSKVVIDATNTTFIDQDVVELLQDFRNTFAPDHHIKINLMGLKLEDESGHILQFREVLDKETRAGLTPERVLDLIKMGNKRFVEGKKSGRKYGIQVGQVAAGQAPMAVIVGCIDSRTSPEITFDAGLGDFLTVRNAGNILSPGALGSLEVAVKHLGVKLIVVKCHTDCGAVKLAMLNEHSGNIHFVTDQFGWALEECGVTAGAADITDKNEVNRIALENAHITIRHMLRDSEYLRERVNSKEVGVVCAFHDIQTGSVTFEELIGAENGVA
jgi:MFS superfamily sulfate permease-like transporter